VLEPEMLAAAWVPNRGGACTTAAVLAGLRVLGAPTVPDLGAATLALGAPERYAAPALMDYVSLPGRPAPLDRRVEELAVQLGIRVRCRTSLTVPGQPLHPAAGEVLVANLAWGQERPGVYGTFGWNPLQPSTYATGGHSVLLVAVEDGAWLVLDSNHPGLQRWPRPGLALTATRISRLG
jgi:hypothetical protein